MPTRDPRAQVWSNNLKQLAGAWKLGTPRDLAAEGFKGWEAKRAQAPNTLQFYRAGKWVVLGLGHERLTQVPEIGKVYTGKVRCVEPYGAFVEILPGQDGLVHISELAPYRVRQTTDVVKEGDEVTVKIIAVDPMGKIKLSRKQALSKEALEAEMAMAPVGGDEGEGPRREDAGPPNRDRGHRGPRR